MHSGHAAKRGLFMERQSTGKRGEILGVAYELFSQTDYDEVPLANIANGAGISKSLLQHYYPQKIDIVKDLLTDLLGIAFSYMEDTADNAEDIMQRVSDFNTLFFKAVANNYKLNWFIISSVRQPDLLDVWIETICEWLKRVCSENTFSYLELRTALCFAMGGSMHLFQHKDELGIDYHYFTDVHIRTILGFLHYENDKIDDICCKTKERVEKIHISAFLQYCEDAISWFTL